MNKFRTFQRVLTRVLLTSDDGVASVIAGTELIIHAMKYLVGIGWYLELHEPSDYLQERTYSTHAANVVEISSSEVMGRVYIGGPMTGLPESNFPLFHDTAKMLRDLCFEVVNPAEINFDAPAANAKLRETLTGDELVNELKKVYQNCMRKDLTELMTCEGIVTLPGWPASSGTCKEVDTAECIGMWHYELIELMKMSPMTRRAHFTTLNQLRLKQRQ